MVRLLEVQEAFMADVKKEFTARQVEVLLQGLEMLKKSLNRRIVAETDVDAGAMWQRKFDEASVLVSKLRLVS